MGDVVVEESSHPIQASFHPCFQRAAPCHRAWLEELLLIMAAGERQMCALEVSRKAAGRSSLIRAERWRRLWGSGRPLPWPFGAVSVSAIIALRRFVPSSFFSAASPHSAFPSVLLGGLTAGAPFCLHVIRILCLHLVLVKLKTSMPCDTPLWRLLLNCLPLPPRLPFAGFRAWQRASSGRSLFLKRSRDNPLCPPSGPTSGPHPAEE